MSVASTSALHEENEYHMDTRGLCQPVIPSHGSALCLRLSCAGPACVLFRAGRRAHQQGGSRCSLSQMCMSCFATSVRSAPSPPSLVSQRAAGPPRHTTVPSLSTFRTLPSSDVSCTLPGQRVCSHAENGSLALRPPLQSLSAGATRGRMPHAPRPQRGYGTSFALQDSTYQGWRYTGGHTAVTAAPIDLVPHQKAGASAQRARPRCLRVPTLRLPQASQPSAGGRNDGRDTALRAHYHLWSACLQLARGAPLACKSSLTPWPHQ
jgi:hypothetical protein